MRQLSFRVIRDEGAHIIKLINILSYNIALKLIKKNIPYDAFFDTEGTQCFNCAAKGSARCRMTSILH